jgi:hypothetical protein
MYWLAIPFALLLFGGFSFDGWRVWNGADRSVEVSRPAGSDQADVTTSEGTVGIPPH